MMTRLSKYRPDRFSPVLAVVACLNLVCGLGCAGAGAPYQPIRLEPMAKPFEPDIPVPANFGLVENASEDRSTGTARLYLRHTYEGSSRKYDVRQFYREQMPLARWIKISDGNVKGEYTMRFGKSDEVCTLLLRDRRGVHRGTEIQVIVSREQRGAVPPGNRN